MKKKDSRGKRYFIKIALRSLLVVSIISLAGFLLLDGKSIDVLDTQGVVADQQRDLIILTLAIGAAVVIPVIVLLFTFAWKYREGGDETYTPEHDKSHLFEAIWWGIPILIIIFLSVVTWVTTHRLDPYKPLETSDQKETIQVVALQWRWLFIYPEHGIATVNDLRFSNQTDVAFKVAADGPMASFWIPKLGSQIYAMNGMTTQLHLQAHNPGVYRGMNTNITGEGYAGMDFNATVTDRAKFIEWVESVKVKGQKLDWNTYERDLAPATRDRGQKYYVLTDADLFDDIIRKYMPHHKGESRTHKSDSNAHKSDPDSHSADSHQQGDSGKADNTTEGHNH